jgi:CRISPR-associated protein Cmr4
MTEKAMLFIHALTSMHPGSGTALGVVDLPVQRERHTGWPVIPASAQKGILRDACRQKIEKNTASADRQNMKAEETAKLTAVFGPNINDKDTAGGNEKRTDPHAGALSVTDARILAFPVRSLKGVFAWVTCHEVLDRLRRDAELAGMDLSEWETPEPVKEGEALCHKDGESVSGVCALPPVKEGEALCHKDSRLLLDKSNKLVLEEYEFTKTGDADKAAGWIATNAVTDSTLRQDIKQRLVVIPDDQFTHFVKHATEVVARVGLDHATKTVKTGALFYQEFLPPETVLYSLVFAENSRKPKKEAKKESGEEAEKGMLAEDVMEYLKKNLPPYLQIGGDETIGKGICAVRLVNGSAVTDKEEK